MISSSLKKTALSHYVLLLLIVVKINDAEEPEGGMDEMEEFET